MPTATVPKSLKAMLAFEGNSDTKMLVKVWFVNVAAGCTKYRPGKLTTVNAIERIH